MLYIPEHTRCTNCGECCGIVPVMDYEKELILDYVKEKLSAEYKLKLKCQQRDIFVCQFRDIEEKKCAIYSARPIICRLMGVTAGMKCANGNTHNINGTSFIQDRSSLLPPIY